MFPKAPRTLMQERHGINAVASAAAKMGVIWRETLAADVGIDGHLEFVTEDGFATGRTIAIQVKSGPSFFQQGDGASWKFRAQEKHFSYWEHYPLPVILVLHDEGAGKSYWVDVRHQIRSSSSNDPNLLAVPKSNILQETSPTNLFESAGAFSGDFIPDINDLMLHMIDRRSECSMFNVSYFDLFVYGLTNVARSLYFGVDIACNAAEFDLQTRGLEFGVGMSQREHEFLFDYIRFLLVQRIADVDYASCLISWREMDLLPSFVAPLTTRGRALIHVVHEEENRMIEGRKLSEEGFLRVAQEGFFQMVEASYIRRLPRVHMFQRRVRERLATSTPTERREPEG